MVSKRCTSRHLTIVYGLWLDESKAMLCKECDHDAGDDVFNLLNDDFV